MTILHESSYKSLKNINIWFYSAIFGQFRWNLARNITRLNYLSIGYQKSMLWCLFVNFDFLDRFWPAMGVSGPRDFMGLGPRIPAKILTQLVDLLGQLLSPNHVLTFSGLNPSPHRCKKIFFSGSRIFSEKNSVRIFLKRSSLGTALRHLARDCQ